MSASQCSWSYISSESSGETVEHNAESSDALFMKPYTVIMQVKPRGSQELPVSSRPVPVYGHDEEEAIERTKRLLEMDMIECVGHASCTEGWALTLSPCGV